MAISAKGWNGQVSFDGTTVTVSRRGFVARTRVGKGEKRFPVSRLQAVQWKDADVWLGYIQFTLAGGVEHRSRWGRASWDANKDENSVTFKRGHQAEFAAVRDAISEALARI